MANLLIMCQMIASKVGKTGLLDVTVDVDSFDPVAMTRAQPVTAAACTEARNGRYFYWIQNFNPALLYAADFMTADATVDQKYLAAFYWDGAWAHQVQLAHLDQDVSDCAQASSYTPARAVRLDHLDMDISDLDTCPPVPSVGFGECR